MLPIREPAYTHEPYRYKCMLLHCFTASMQLAPGDLLRLLLQELPLYFFPAISASTSGASIGACSLAGSIFALFCPNVRSSLSFGA